MLTKEDALNIHGILMRRVVPRSTEEGLAIATLAAKVAEQFKLIPEPPGSNQQVAAGVAAALDKGKKGKRK